MNSAISLLFYLLVFFVASILFWYGNRSKRHLIFALIAIVMLSMVAAVRYEVGTDYVAYANAYNALSGITPADFFNNFGDKYEIGIYIIAQIAGLSSYSIPLFFGIFSFITVLFFFLAARKYELPYPWLLMALYLLIMFPSSLNAVRQLAAISIFFYATTFIFEKKIIKYIVLVLIASIFHKSAALLLPVYFIGKCFTKGTAIRPKTMIMLLVVATLLTVFGAIGIQMILGLSFLDKYDKYQNLSAASGGLVLTLKIVVLAVVLAFYRHIKKYTYSSFCIVMALLEVVVLAVSRNSVDIARFSLYFTPFSLILLAYLPKVLRGGQQLILILVILVYAVAMFYISFYLLHGSDIFPYNYMIFKGNY